MTRDINYAQWADYIEKIFAQNGLTPKLILDLGCGTGSMCIELSRRRYEMIGVDSSVDMLACAKQKAIDENMDILFLNQDISTFELYGTVDACLCLLDTLNYITENDKAMSLFKLVHNYLNPGGLFIFDINTYYKFEHVLADNVYYSIDDDIAYIWQNEFDKSKNLCRFDLTFFVSNEEGLYERYDEVHTERAYTHEEISGFINMSGLTMVSCYDGLSFSKPVNTSERVFYVCRKE